MIVGEEYTNWPDQFDFSAELTKARAAKPDAIFAFYPGGAGVQFLTQYSQFGFEAADSALYRLHRRRLSLPRLEGSGLGRSRARSIGSIDLPNEANKKFVAGFHEKV